MDTIALANSPLEAAAAAKKPAYPHEQLKHCVGCGETITVCACTGCNCATCARKQELQQAELECGGCHHKKKHCECKQSHSDAGVTTGKPAARSTTTEAAAEP